MSSIPRRAGSLAAVIVLAGLAAAGGAERKKVRVIFDFEEAGETKKIEADDNMTLDVVQDNGVTRGANCLRVVGKMGKSWAAMVIRGDTVGDVSDFDYFAMDVYTERTEKLRMVFELWDQNSTNYATRCTFENERTHVGKNTLLWKINRPKRNNKEGLEWHELQPKDKIDRANLKMIKIFFTPFKAGGNTVLWIDNMRFMQEDAVGGRIKVKLPAGAIPVDFGNKGSTTPGFTWAGASAPGVSGNGVQEMGKLWPDPLTGDAIGSLTGEVTYELAAPDGDYWVWLNAGRILDEKSRTRPYLLKVGDETLVDETLTAREFYGERGIFRHLRTQYSERPNALWLDYVNTVARSRTVKATAAGGKLVVRASNHRLAALVAVPSAGKPAFDEMVEEIKAQRIRLFYAPLFFDKHERPKPERGDGPYAMWSPHFATTVRPWTAPTPAERAARALDLHAARGSRVVGRVCVHAFENLGTGEIAVSDLKGPGTIPADKVRAYYQNYRQAGSGVTEMALLPWTKIRFEPGITWAYWLWLEVPADAAPGDYRGTVTFTPEQGRPRRMRMSLKVHDFELDDRLPVSYGMYYSPWSFPAGVDRRQKILEQHRFMREVGFTATCVGSGRGIALRGGGKVRVNFDPLVWEIAKAVGMGRHPEQRMMGNSLTMARQIARRMGMSPAVDQQPGLEFTREAELKPYYLDAIRQYKAFAAKMDLPFAVETVDEPREMPNPWNRNMVQTNKYADWIGEVGGLKTFVTPMGDTQSGKDYTPLVDHHDIVSVHATSSSRRMIAKTKRLGKTLWFYNTGKDRFSWGFYNWRMQSKGRWEWHFAWGGGGAADYPCPDERYTSFTGHNGYAIRAPYWEYPGGMLFKSDYLNMAQGITDYAYLVTLQKAIAASKKPAAAKKARDFLAALRKAIPELPKVKGIASAEDGALVGAGIETPVAENSAMWRRRIAELIEELK